MNHREGEVRLDPLLPAEMALRAEEIGEAKARLPWLNLGALSVLAGAFIALGAAFFTTVTTDTDMGYGPTRLIGGLAFSLGLFLVVVAGAELFTGNNLMVMAWAGLASARCCCCAPGAWSTLAILLAR